MSTHNISFQGEIRKNSNLIPTLIWIYVYSLSQVFLESKISAKHASHIALDMRVCVWWGSGGKGKNGKVTGREIK